MEPKRIPRQQAFFLAGAVLLIAALVVVALSIHNAPQVKTTTTPGQRGGSPTATVTRAEPTRVTGLKGRTYYGETIKISLPAGVTDIESVGDDTRSDQLIFTFPGGNGTITSQPNDASMNMAQLERSYPGKKGSIEIAGSEGFSLDQSSGSVDAVTAIAYRGPLMLTIQLSGKGDRAQLDKLVQELGAAITLRPVQAATTGK